MPNLPTTPNLASLLDVMKDGAEYSSLLAAGGAVNIDVIAELRKAVSEIEEIRQRPCICYTSNVLRAGDRFTAIELADDVPFSELVASIPENQKAIDIFLATPGGSGNQVHSFVQKLRPRFDQVGFIVPHMAMSAGTIFALSGNEIIMDERAFLGPIDPQVVGRDGRYVPAQSLFTLVKQIQEQGAEALKNGQQPEWANIQILRNIDPKELGNALSATKYAVQLASSYLENFKFQSWTNHTSDNRPVTPNEKADRALAIAKQLSSHDFWKAHSHGIFRDALWSNCRIKIIHAESIGNLERAIRRLWALFYWSFEHTAVQKVYLSQNYSLMRLNQRKA